VAASQSDIRRKAYALAKEIGLDRQDRHALSNMILCNDHDSWRHISDTQLARVLDAMEGFALVTYLLTENSRLRQAGCPNMADGTAQS
jgi:hypothetical protein